MNPIQPGPLLAQINDPADLRKLELHELDALCAELRHFIIAHCAEFGGHFGASLGVVELTVALHYIYNTPEDLLVWDVGHQAYGHKLLTGRRDQFHTNRTYHGIAGFPKRGESAYDTFGVGHSSTSISAALGMALAAEQKGEDRKAVAIIGDGALTGGMSFEALNHAGSLSTDLLVVLNDNSMSIDPNVGALKAYLTDITVSRTYNRLRDEAWQLLGRLNNLGPRVRGVASKLEDLLTHNLTKPGRYFESLGFRYFGPVDGHDVYHLTKTLEDLRQIRGPKLLHINTVKGKGFAPAEADQTKWHAASQKFCAETGEKLVVPKAQDALADAPAAPKPPKYQDVFGETCIELAERDQRVRAITPAMLSGSGLVPMHTQMPDKCIDVGIAEQHAVTFSAGLATQGLIPFCAIYSTFLQRGYDQLVHDVAIQDLKVIFGIDRAGLVGADGPTHHGAYDLAYLRAIPNLVVAAPMNEAELRHLMWTAMQDDQPHPFAIRYPRGQGVMPNWRVPMEVLPIGQGQQVAEGEDVAILTIGHVGNFVPQARKALAEQGLHPAHYNMRFVKPLDEAMLHSIGQQYRAVVTVEDGCLPGGFGDAVATWLLEHGYTPTLKRLGIPDRVVQHGSQKELWRECGYDAQAIQEAVHALAEKLAASTPARLA